MLTGFTPAVNSVATRFGHQIAFFDGRGGRLGAG